MDWFFQVAFINATFQTISFGWILRLTWMNIPVALVM